VPSTSVACSHIRTIDGGLKGGKKINVVQSGPVVGVRFFFVLVTIIQVVDCIVVLRQIFSSSKGFPHHFGLRTCMAAISETLAQSHICIRASTHRGSHTLDLCSPRFLQAICIILVITCDTGRNTH